MSASESKRPIAGRCHCGNIAFTFFWPGSGPVIPVRACGCSFCRKHGGVYTSHPQGRLEVKIADDSLIERYRFGHETADFHVCRRCGVVPVITSEIEGRTYAVVNVNAFEGVDRSELAEAAADFEGEDPGGRLARRQGNWIPEVEIRTAG